ncbi:MAG TPA: DUF255 domain-containing protein [Bacteroidales bacterium]|nr:DUF255 domain-containing protein [Bacteroidales bacterium]
MRNRFIILSLLVCWALPGLLTAQEKAKSPIKWYSFEEAYKLNKKKPKKMFVDVFTEWCGWCKKMDAETFTHPVIAKYMSDNFYCVKLDAERKDTVMIDGHAFVNQNPAAKRSTHQLAIDLLQGRMSYPSYVFLNEKGQKINVVPGYLSPVNFESVVKYFGSDAYLKSSLDEYRKTFQGDIK